MMFRELSNAEVDVVILIKKYLNEYKRSYFTYDDIKVYAARTGFYRQTDLTDRTVDRVVRGLASAGYFKRVSKVININGRKKRITIFVPTEDFHLYKVIW
ncbi:MAG: hypothetical protein QXZ63_07555 [Sulfolobales archaeon]